jgi:hypothetical protein
MKPIDFEHTNTKFAEHQDQYTTLPALKIESDEGYVITCWKLTFFEKLKVLFSGKIWMSLMTFNKSLTPSFLSVNRSNVYYHPDDDKKFLKKLKKKLDL